MKQSELLLATLTEAVAALVKRMGEVEGIARIPGEKGDTGADGRDGRDADPVSDEQIKAAAAEWLAANITQPADGRDGADGQDGQDAPPITAEQIQLAVDLWFEINRDSIRGADGINGLNGRDGIDGTNGIDGRNGIDGTTGKDGADGVGIALIEQRDDASFHITLNDGREFQINLPEPKRTTIVGGGGGGLSKTQADLLYAPIGSGGGAAQEIYIGAPSTLPNHPALIFTQRTIDGQTVYEMQVNVP